MLRCNLITEFTLIHQKPARRQYFLSCLNGFACRTLFPIHKGHEWGSYDDVILWWSHRVPCSFTSIIFRHEKNQLFFNSRNYIWILLKFTHGWFEVVVLVLSKFVNWDLTNRGVLGYFDKQWFCSLSIWCASIWLCMLILVLKLLSEMKATSFL